MNRMLFILILFATLISFTGCINIKLARSEIQDMTFIQVIGIDKVPGQDKVRVTIISKHTVSKKEGELIPENTISVEGETIFDAIRKLNMYSIRKPFWAHADFILIDEEAAKDGIIKYLDFFSSQNQFRLAIKPLIVIGDTAERVITTSSTKELFISDKLDLLVKNLSNLSVSDNIELRDLLEIFDRPYASAFIPCIYQTDTIYKEKSESEKQDIAMNGFAIFENGKMIGYIKNDQAKGLNWVNGRYKSGVIVVRDEIGKKISLEVINEETKVLPKINNNNKLSITVIIKVLSNIGEMYSNTDIFNEKSFRFMEEQQQEIVKSQAESIIKYAQENKADMLYMWNRVFHKYPKKWKNMYNKWPEVFSNIPFTVEVDSKIVRRYMLKQPIGAMEVEK